MWVYLCAAAEWRTHSPEEALHQGGDGQSADGEKPVQRETDGATGSCAVDRDDKVQNKTLNIYTCTPSIHIVV